MSIPVRSLLAFLFFVPASFLHGADMVYRCNGPDGVVSYQNSRCLVSGERIPVDPSTKSGWSELRAGEKSLLVDYRAREKNRRAARKKSGSDNKPKKPGIDSAGCWKKEKRLEAVKSKLRRGYRATEGERLKRKRKNYQEYLDKFCS